MDFNNSTLLAYNRTSEFFSDTMRYRVNKELTIKGLLLELTNSSGVKPIVDDLRAFESGFLYNWQPISLNGVSFGSGIVSAISYSEGNDVRTKEYTATISVPESGDPYTSGVYQNLNFNNFQYIESFSESSEFTRDVGKDNYVQNVDITIKPPTTLDAVNAAKTIASNFFDNNNLSNTIGQFTSYADTKRFYTENYDPINGKFTFNRNFELYKNSDGTYSLYRDRAINFDNDGVLSVTETANYIGHTMTGAFDLVNNQAKTDIASAFSRCSPLVSTYGLGGDNALQEQPISKSWNSSPFEYKISYEITFSNALRIGAGAFKGFHDYSIEVVESQGGIYTVKQNGSIIGYGEVKYNKQKYNNALSYFNGLTINLSSYAPATLRLASSSSTHSDIEGKISYDYIYTNSDSLLADTTVRKILTKISKDYRRNLSSSFNIVNYKEIAQIQLNTLTNNISYYITVNGKAGTDINTFLAAAKNIITSNPPPSPSYLNDVNYTFNPFDRELTLNVTYLNFETS